MIGEFSMMQRFIMWQLLNYIVDYSHDGYSKSFIMRKR